MTKQFCDRCNVETENAYNTATLPIARDYCTSDKWTDRRLDLCVDCWHALIWITYRFMNKDRQ